MAIVFFVENSGVDESAVEQRHVPMDRITRSLGSFERKYSGHGPFLNRRSRDSSVYSPCRNVVVKVGADEVDPSFTAPGYYWIVGITPAQVTSRLKFMDAATDVATPACAVQGTA